MNTLRRFISILIVVLFVTAAWALIAQAVTAQAAALGGGKSASEPRLPLAPNPGSDVYGTIAIQGGSATPGNTLRYGVTYGNAGQAQSASVRMTATLPASVHFLRFNGLNAPQRSGNQLTWDIPMLAANSSLGFSVDVQTPVTLALGTELTAYLQIKSVDPDADLTNNTTFVTTTVFMGSSDLIVYKYLEGDLPRNNPALYRITVSNYSPDSAVDVIVTDTLPVGTAYLGSQGAPAPVVSGRMVTWRIPYIPGTLEPWHEVAINLQAQVSNALAIGQWITNTVTASAGNELAPGSSHTAAAAGQIKPASHEAGVYQTTIKQPVQGAKVVYCAVFENMGNSPMANVVVTSTLPAGVELLGVQNSLTGCSPGGILNPAAPLPRPAAGSFAPPAPVHAGNDYVRWEIPALPGNAGAYIWITALAPASLPVGWIMRYHIEITSTTLEGGAAYTLANRYDGQDDLAAPLRNVALSLTPYSNVVEFQPGHVFEYELNVTATGNLGLNGVVVTGTLPAGMTYDFGQSFPDPTGWTRVASGNQVVLSGPLQPNQQQRFYIRASILATQPRSTTLEFHAWGAIPEPETSYGDNLAALRLPVLADGVDLSVEKHWESGERTPGGQIVYQINYANLGNLPASGVVVSDTLPAGLTFADWSTSDGAGVWSVITSTAQVARFERAGMIDIGPGEKGSLYVYANVGAAANGAVLINQADIDGFASDVFPANNHFAQPLAFYTNPVDVTVWNSIGSGPPAGQQPFTYNLQYGNNGSSPAANVILTDTLPSGLIFNLATIAPSQILMGGRQLVWNLGTIPGAFGANIGLQVYAAPGMRAGTEVCNTLAIDTSSPETGVTPNEKVYCAPYLAAVENLVVNAYQASDLPGVPGGGAESYYGFQNLGNTDAHNVGITITLPAGSTLQSWYGEVDYTPIGTAPTQTGSQVVWRIPNIPLGGSGFIRPVFSIPQAAQPGDYFATQVEINSLGRDVSPADNQDATSLLLIAPAVGVNLHANAVVMDYAVGRRVWITVTDSNGAHILGTYTGITSLYDGAYSSSGLSTQPQNWAAGYAPMLKDGQVVSVATDLGYHAQLTIGKIKGALDSLTNSAAGTVTAPWLTPALPDGKVKVICAQPVSHGWPKVSAAAADGTTPFACAWNPAAEWDIQPGEQVLVTYFQPDGSWVAAPLIEPAPDPAVGMDAPSAVYPGGRAIYKVMYANQGVLPAHNVGLTQILPDGAAWLTDTSGLARTLNGTIVDWVVGELQPGETHSFVLYAQAPSGAAAGDVFTSTISITSTTPDLFVQNNASQARVNVRLPDPALSVKKATRTWNPAPGKTFVYEIGVCNTGTTNSDLLDLTDSLPAVTSLVDWWSDEPGWYEVSRSPQNLHLQNVALAPLPWCRPVFVRVLLDPAAAIGAVFTNTAAISSTFGVSAPGSTAYSTLQAGPETANLAVYLDPVPSIQTPGGELRYDLRVENNGNVPVTGTISLQDWFPAGTSFLGAYAGPNAITPSEVYSSHVVFTFQGLENGFSHAVQVLLQVGSQVAPGSVLENTAYVLAAPAETMLKDNKSILQTTIYPHGPNLVVKKSGGWDAASGAANPLAHFKIDVYNAGDAAAYPLVLTDTYPTGFEVVGVPYFGAYNTGYQNDAQNHRLTAQFNPLAAGSAFVSSIDLRYTGTGALPPGLGFSNQVIVSAQAGEVIRTDNQAQFALFSGPDLSVEKFVFSGFKEPGGVITYAIVVHNWQAYGTSWWDMQGSVLLTDTLPAGMTYLRAFTGWEAPMYAKDALSHQGQQVAFDLEPIQGGGKDWLFVVAKIADNLPNNTALENFARAQSSLPGLDLEYIQTNNYAMARFVAIVPPTPPTAVGDVYTTTQGMTLRIPLPGLLGNDLNPDGSRLAAVLATTPGHGSVMVNPDGGFAYAPDPDFTGIDVFAYKAANLAGSSAPAQVTVHVTPRPQDLFSSNWALHSAPGTIFESSPVSLTLKVFRQGGSGSLTDVSVRYYLEDASAVFLGEVVIPSLAPFSSSVTPALTWNAGAPGTYRLVAVIDPDNLVAETDESNNMYVRTITVLRRPLADVTPPVITAFGVDNGAQISADRAVNLHIQALDSGGSGMRSVMFVQFTYSQTINAWAPVFFSPWMPYSAGVMTYTLDLTDQPGIHYWRAWAADQAGNLSEPSSLGAINYNPASAGVAIGTGVIYRVRLYKDDHLVVTLTSLSGDADVFVWGPGNNPVGESILETSPDVVDFIAAQDGVYQIDIVGYTDAVYSLTLGGVSGLDIGADFIPFVPIPAPHPKARSVPIASVADNPVNEEVALPPAITYLKLYLPVQAR